MPQLSSLAVLAAAAVIALAAAYPTKEDDIYYSRVHELPVLEYRQEPRNLDGIGGGNLLKDLDALRTRAALLSRDSRGASGGHYMDVFGSNTLGGVKRSGCCDSLSGIGIGSEKRNMDEIDRSSFNSFVKRNFDEIDRSGFGGFVKKNFDEIDRSGFGSFVKRSAPSAPAEAHN